MDARERLRRYLEQRRELGESEFVLDALTVDEALRHLAGGAQRPASPTGERPGSGGHVTPPPAPVNTPAPSPSPPPAIAHRVAAESAGGEGDDWRTTLAGPTESDSAAVDPWPPWLAPLGLPRGTSRSAPPLPASAAALAGLDEVARAVAACSACGLHRTARSHVPGTGHPRADLMCIGEAPGADEDLAGEPFVGEAGKLLTKILGAINLPRDAVFIANVLKHRPPGNRDPEPDEMQACLPFLWRQVALVQPRVILALGRVAAQAITGTTQGIGALRGKVHLLMGIPVVATYHPAALLRNAAWKRPTWEDVQVAQRLLEAARGHDAGGGASGVAP